MSLFTAVGTGLWTWEPFRRLERHHEDVVGRCTKLFWLALYTTPEAKMSVPGLFVGSVTTMAEAARMPVDATRTYLDRLLDDDMVEYDVENRVLRMTVLPDAGESPSNGRAIRGWWRRFQNVPACAVRDAHSSVLRWILDEWCRTSGKSLSNDHTAAWNETFGRLPIPAPRRRAVRHVQTDLFALSGSRNPKINNLDTNNNGTSVPLDPDQDPEQDQDQDLLRSEGGSGGDGITAPMPGKPPVLTLVPHPAFGADDLAETLSKATGGKFSAALTRDQRIALGRAIDLSGDVVMHPSALAFLGEYVASLTSLRAASGGDCGISIELVVSPGWISTGIKRGMDWKLAEQQQGTEA